MEPPPGSSDGASVAAATYGGVMTGVAIMFNVVWRYAAKDQPLPVAGISREAIARSHRNYLAGPIVYGAATGSRSSSRT